MRSRRPRRYREESGIIAVKAAPGWGSPATTEGDDMRMSIGKVGRAKRGLLAAGASVLLMLPVVPASASTTAETCHPPNYDTLQCACEAVGRIWIKVTGGQWYCGV